MGFDELLTYLGEFGKYQRRIYLLLCLPAIACALHKLAWVFLGAKAAHRCIMPFEDPANVTFAIPPENMRMMYPKDSTSPTSFSQCSRYKANFTEEYFTSQMPANESIPCVNWIYDYSQYESSATFEFGLVCDKAWLRASADMIFMSGVLVGSILFGWLSDRYGRRPIFFLSLLIQVIGGIAAGLAPEYVTFVLARMCIGATTSGVFLVAYVIGMEMVGPSKRMYAGVVVQYFFTIGYLLTALFAYLITDWRTLQIALSLPGLLFLSYYWFIPESARWLLTKGEDEKARAILMKVAQENNVKVESDTFDKFLGEVKGKDDQNPNQKQATVVDLFRYPNLRRKSIIIFILWFVNSGTYYGLSWNTSNLGGNDYINFLISGAVEVPGYTFLLLALNRWGRKSTLCGAMLVGGCALVLTVFVPQDLSWILISLAMFGKMAITASYGAVYVFTAEQFPTVIRNVALGTSSTVARVGGMLAPFVILLSDFWKPLPLLIFGGLAFVAGSLALMLPETLNRKLPETIEEGEKFGRDDVEEENQINMEQVQPQLHHEMKS